LGGIALLTTPCFPVFSAHQESDVPLAVYLAAAAALLVLADRESPQARRLLLLAGFAAGLGAWTKNEGALYAACLAAGLGVRSRSRRAVGWFVAGALPAGALVVAFKTTVAPPTDLVAFSTASGVLSRALDPWRWGQLAVLTVRRIVYFQDFAAWAAAEVLVLATVVRKLPGSAIGTALFLACTAYAPIYVLQPHPLPWLYAHSVERIFIQLWPAAIFATLLPLARAAGQPPEATSGSWPMERGQRAP
jgi:4-amino-4-deoxy-L-arabinose transferase-like glycosyltransferase